MANAEKLLRALLAKAYKKQETEIDQILSETTDDNAGETAVIGWDTSRVAEIKKPVPGSTFQDGYAKAKKEVLTTLESELKAKYSIEDDATGIDLIELAIQNQTGDASKLTEDQVRKHPLFLTFERDMKKQLKDKDAEITNKVAEVEGKFKRNETLNAVKGEALKFLDPLKPVLPGTPTVANTIKSNFLKEFEAFDFEKQTDGRFLAMKDGKVYTDAHGNSLYLEDLVKATAPNYFEFQQNNGGGNAGNGGADDQNKNNGGGGAAYPTGIAKPTSFEELSRIVNDTKVSAEDRQTVLKVWESEQSGQK